MRIVKRYLRSIGRHPIALCACLIVAVSFHFPSARAAGDLGAEFAVRWDPKQGGPASAHAVLSMLGLKATDTDVYEVRYFTATQGTETLPGFDVILRERVKKKKELTYKLRGEKPLPASAPSIGKWECALGAAAKKKDEIDVSFIADGQVKKVYSRSCEVDGDAATLAFPASLGAKPKGCKSSMTRLKAGDLKIEEWRLGPGAMLIEVSRNGKDNAAETEAFRKQIVAAVSKAGAAPVDRSKSEAGSDCK